MNRIQQLQKLRDSLNRLGDWHYMSDASTHYVRPHQLSAEWNRKRVRLRNRINARLRAIGA